MRRALSGLLAAVVAGGAAVAASVVPAAAAVPATPGSYVPIAPYRAADTATGAHGNRKGALPARSSSRVSLSGHVPASASAAVVSLTVVGATANGHVVAYRDGLSTPPGIWTTLVRKGVTTTVSTLVALSSARFRLYNGSGAGKLGFTVDVLGYYAGGKPASGAPGVMRLVTPRRATPHSTTLKAGKSVVISTGVTGAKASVAAMVHVSSAAKAGSVAVYAYQTPAPAVSQLYFPAGYGTSGFQQVHVDTDGKIVVLNRSAGTVTVAVDVLGSSLRYPTQVAGGFETLDPVRIASAVSIGGGKVTRLGVAGRGGVARTGTGTVFVSVTTTAGSHGGGIVVGAPGRTTTGTRTISFAAKQTVGNAVPVPTSGGAIDVRNVSAGTARVYVDVLGYYPTTAITAPAAQPARYPNDLTGDASHDTTVMNSDGCLDGKNGATFVLLDIGAQTTSTPLSSTNPGVALTPNSSVHLTYAQLVTAVAAYLQGFVSCRTAKAATVAVGTNNDGVFDTKKADYYAPADRGADWATKVIAPLAAQTHAGITVVGADDIEAGFASTEAQAQAWENAYLKATKGTLIYNGSLDGCPASYGATGACLYGWTQAQYVSLTYGGGRVQTLPQIYNHDAAVRWSNLDKASGNRLHFVGALAETVGGKTPAFEYTPARAWAALWRALSASRNSVPTLASVRITADH